MSDRPITISITSGTLVKTVVILALAWLVFFLHDIVLVLLTAIVISSAVEPGVKALVRRRVPRVVSVIAVYLLLFTSFFSLFYFFIPSVLEDFVTFASSLPTYFQTLSDMGFFNTYAQIFGITGPSSISGTDVMNALQGVLGVAFFGNAFSAIAAVFGGFFSFILIVVFSFYFAVQETGVDDFLRIVAPHSHRDYVVDLWKRSQHKIGLWMQGQLILAVLIGVLVYLGLTILGVKHALILALIAGLFEIIPVFGPILAAIPAIAIAFVDGGPTLGLLTIALYVVTQQFENHLIYPLVVTRVVGVPPLLVILALIVGAEMAGFLGIILSVPAAATIQEFAKDWEIGHFTVRHRES